jgi:hypothetical protein
MLAREEPSTFEASSAEKTLHRALQEPQRGPALRCENLKHLAFVIHRTPEIMRLAIDPDEHLV